MAFLVGESVNADLTALEEGSEVILYTTIRGGDFLIQDFLDVTEDEIRNTFSKNGTRGMLIGLAIGGVIIAGYTGMIYYKKHFKKRKGSLK